MRTGILQIEQYEELKEQFLDVFSNEPWFDKWENEQLDMYLQDLISNRNSLSLVFFDESNKIIGGSLGYVLNWWQGREYFIKEFFVSRNMQNKGLGSVFLNQMNEYLKNQQIKAICLSTEKTAPAYKFYHKNGFFDLQDSVFLAKNIE